MARRDAETQRETENFNDQEQISRSNFLWLTRFSFLRLSVSARYKKSFLDHLAKARQN